MGNWHIIGEVSIFRILRNSEFPRTTDVRFKIISRLLGFRKSLLHRISGAGGIVLGLYFIYKYGWRRDIYADAHEGSYTARRPDRIGQSKADRATNAIRPDARILLDCDERTGYRIEWRNVSTLSRELR